MSLKTDINTIIKENYSNLLDNAETILDTEFDELTELIHITLECAYDNIYDREFVDSYLKSLFKIKILIDPTDPNEPHHHHFIPKSSDDEESEASVEVEVEDKTELVKKVENDDSVSVGSLEFDLPDSELTEYQRKINELKSRSVTSQRTTDWLKVRHEYITASVMASALSLMGKSSRENLLLEKASYGDFKTFFGNIHTHHGNQFEPVTNAIYCYRNNTKIYDYGLIPHKTVPFLGASTDGVTSELRNIEIKSLTSRILNGKVKKEYYHQMQLQMECLNLTVTDFIEAKYYQYKSLQEFLDDFYYESEDKEQSEKGCMIEVLDLKSKQLDYIYSPIEYYLDDKKMTGWLKEQHELVAKRDDVVYVRDVYWEVTEYSCIEVKRDPNWMKQYYPVMKQFWDEVLELRGNPDLLTEALIDVEERKRERSEAKKNGSSSGGGSKLDVICMV